MKFIKQIHFLALQLMEKFIRNSIIMSRVLGYNITSELDLGHSMSSNTNLGLTHPRIWQKFAKLLQYKRYDNPENFSLIHCMD